MLGTSSTIFETQFKDHNCFHCRSISIASAGLNLLVEQINGHVVECATFPIVSHKCLQSGQLYSLVAISK